MTTHSDDSDFLDEPARLKKSGRRFRLVYMLGAAAILVLLIGLLLPAVRSARGAFDRVQCSNNLRQIALALRDYESAYQALPPAHTVDAAGRPLHSWRTLILPYLGQKPLYDAVDLSKPWNDPANAKAYATVVSTYRCPGQGGPGVETTYLAIVGTDACFLPDKSRRLSEITDDPRNTLMVIEADRDHAVHWMAPSDADESLVNAIGAESKLNHARGGNTVCVDGRVLFLRIGDTAVRRRSLISISGDDDEDLLDF